MPSVHLNSPLIYLLSLRNTISKKSKFPGYHSVIISWICLFLTHCFLAAGPEPGFFCGEGQILLKWNFILPTLPCNELRQSNSHHFQVETLGKVKHKALEGRVPLDPLDPHLASSLSTTMRVYWDRKWFMRIRRFKKKTSKYPVDKVSKGDWQLEELSSKKDVRQKFRLFWGVTSS